MKYDLHFLTPLLLASLIGVSIYYCAEVRDDDGESCRRDIECVRQVCLEDRLGHYCSRPCDDDEDCSEGWRCIRPPGPRNLGRSCVRP